MKQGLLAFQYEQEKGSTGMTGLSGLMTYLELMQAAGLRSSVERHERLRETGQGWTDSQMIISLMLLNLAGGESVSDLNLLEEDEGLCRMLREFETSGKRLIHGFARLSDGNTLDRRRESNQVGRTALHTRERPHPKIQSATRRSPRRSWRASSPSPRRS